MKSTKDIVGLAFGLWTVLRQAPHPANRADTGAYWHVRCGGCGREFVRLGSSLRSGHSKSCQSCANRAAGAHAHAVL
jgi:hypothetical protein